MTIINANEKKNANVMSKDALQEQFALVGIFSIFDLIYLISGSDNNISLLVSQTTVGVLNYI